MVAPIYFYEREKEFGFLSNFERTAFFALAPDAGVDGIAVKYPTNEHFYQSCRARPGAIRDYIISAPHAWYAMKIGRSLRPADAVPDWDKVKLGIMENGLFHKFQDRVLARMLLATGEAPLHENSPTDYFWGCGAKKTGASWLGKLLEKVRSELRRARAGSPGQYHILTCSNCDSVMGYCFVGGVKKCLGCGRILEVRAEKGEVKVFSVPCRDPEVS